MSLTKRMHLNYPQSKSGLGNCWQTQWQTPLSSNVIKTCGHHTETHGLKCIRVVDYEDELDTTNSVATNLPWSRWPCRGRGYLLDTMLIRTVRPKEGPNQWLPWDCSTTLNIIYTELHWLPVSHYGVVTFIGTFTKQLPPPPQKKLLTLSCPSYVLAQKCESHGIDLHEISNTYFMVQIGQKYETLHENICTLTWLFFFCNRGKTVFSARYELRPKKRKIIYKYFLCFLCNVGSEAVGTARDLNIAIEHNRL
jgi:hypothetical protein